MNVELLNKLGIDESLDLKSMLEELEDKQFEIFERLEAVSDESRREELSELNKAVEHEIASVKEEIRSLSSALIIDDEEEAVAAAKEEEKQSKKEAVASKLNALKEKEAKKREKEETPKEQAAVDEEVSPAGESVHSKEFDMALRDYKNQNYGAAFSVFKKYAESGDAEAQYLLSQMYSAGNGAKQDAERAEFWLRSSADNGDISAQFGYGMQLISTNNDDDKRVAEGLRYLAMAADKDYKNAMIQYIETINKGYGDVETANKAVGYCSKLIASAADSFESKKCDEYMKELKKTMKSVKGKDMEVKLTTGFTILGAILLLIGGVYFFGGTQAELWESNAFLKAFPDASSKWLLPIKQAWDFLKTYMNVNGMFGLELILFAVMFSNAGNNAARKKYSNAFSKVAMFAMVALVVWYFYEMIVNNFMAGTGNEEAYMLRCCVHVVSVIVVYAVGSAIGSIIKNIVTRK